MMNYLKISRHGVGRWINPLVIGWGLFFNPYLHAEEKMKTNYIVSFNTNAAFCLAKVNDILVMNSGDSERWNYSAGQTISSILENGSNTVAVSMLKSPWEDDAKLTDDMWCSVVIKEVGEGKPVAGVKLIVNDGEIQVDKKFHPAPIVYFGESHRKDEDNTVEVAKKFIVEQLPDWNWTKATPVTDADIPKVKEFYQALQQAFIQQDLKKIRKMTSNAWDIMAKEKGASEDVMWGSMDFKGRFDKGYKADTIDWNGYNFYSYKNGRIFRFEDGYERLSPIMLKNKDGRVFYYNPYLSIIDGKVTVVH